MGSFKELLILSLRSNDLNQRGGFTASAEFACVRPACIMGHEPPFKCGNDSRCEPKPNAGAQGILHMSVLVLAHNAGAETRETRQPFPVDSPAICSLKAHFEDPLL